MRIALVGAAAAALVCSAGSGAGTGPEVALLRATPVTIAGSGYAARAPVAVVYRSGPVSVRRTVVTSRAGGFRLVLTNVVFRRCAGLQLTAGHARIAVPSCAVAGGAPTVTVDPGGLAVGSSFVPGEAVALTAAAGDARIRSDAHAGSGGGFRVRLDLPKAMCAEIHLVAVGALGSRAADTAPAPDCIAP